MIRYVKAENCYSFLNETLLDFRVNNKAPQSKKYQDSQIEGERLAKVVCIVGPNASGKSNLLRIISFLKWFLVESFGQKPDQEIHLPPFLLKEGPYSSSRIEVEFETDSHVYQYATSFTAKGILSEELHVLDLGQQPPPERRRFKQLFSRNFDQKLGEYTIKSHADFGLSEGIEEIIKTRKNASLISAALFSNHEQSRPIKNYWSNTLTNIKQPVRRFRESAHVLESTRFYHENKEFLARAEEIISRCDLGLVGVKIAKREFPPLPGESEKNVMLVPFGKHPGLDGKQYELPFYMESSGTQRIYTLLSSLLPVLESGGLAVIDELEIDLHPAVLPSILELFVNPNSNPKAAQLIFTCHATPLLNELDKYQVIIVEKGEDGVSEAWRLDQIEGVRNDDNFFAKYASGAYGGLPEISKFRNVAK